MIGDNTGTYSDFKGRNRMDYFTLDIYEFYFLALASVPKEITEIPMAEANI
jgi:hypothetical protein